MKKKLLLLCLSLSLVVCTLGGCFAAPLPSGSSSTAPSPAPAPSSTPALSPASTPAPSSSSAAESSSSRESSSSQGGAESADSSEASQSIERYEDFTVSAIPPFTGTTYNPVHGNLPFFTEEEIAKALEGSYEYYSPLDDLGRCGYAMASIGTDLMPTGSRGEIYWIHPSGWQRNQEYERSHLIAFQLAGENDNEQNLITGTHFLNNDGMRPFEELVGDYVRESGHNVLYRVTPVYSGNELVARGVLMEALSLYDNGGDIAYCVFIYNVYDPSLHRLIDYATGKAYDGELEIDTGAVPGSGSSVIDEGDGQVHQYIVNRRSLIFHYPTCDGAKEMSEKNRMEFEGTRVEAIEAGYTPCPGCKP